MNCSLLSFSIQGIHQARILEWVAIFFSRRSSRPRDRTHVSHIAGRLFTVWATGETFINKVNLTISFFFFLINLKPTFILGNKFISKFAKIHSLFYILPNSSSSCSVAKLQPWDCSLPAALSMAFSKQEYWNGLSFSSPGDLSDPGIEPESPTLPVYFLPLRHKGTPYCQISFPDVF